MKVNKNIAYGQNPRQKLDVYSKGNGRQKPVIIFWHGGSWSRGSKDMYTLIGRSLAKLGYAVVIPEYRLHPEVQLEGILNDAAAASAWVRKHIGEYGGDPERMVIMGHSAGAHIAVELALNHRYLQSAKVPLSAIKACIGLSGAYDFEPGPNIRPIFDMNNNDWRPITLAHNATMPFLFIHGRLDFTVYARNSVSLARSIHEAGGQADLKLYPLADHMTTLFGLVPPLSLLWPTRRHVQTFLSRNI